MYLIPGKSGLLLTPGGGDSGRPPFEPVLGDPLRHQEIQSILALNAMLLKQPHRVLGEVELINIRLDSLMPKMCTLYMLFRISMLCKSIHACTSSTVRFQGILEANLAFSLNTGLNGVEELPFT